jgi:hypothetical protein
VRSPRAGAVVAAAVRTFLAVGALGALGALAACGTASGEPGALPVPTFPAAAQAAPGTAAAADQGRLPDDCTRVLAGNDLGALFGLPVDSVAVRTTIGVAAPAVGRTERLACQYTRTGGARDDLLDVNIGAYTDADSASRQWQTNVAAEDGVHRDVALGDAKGVLVERPQEAVLMVANGAETLTFVLPGRVRIRDLSAGDTLVDLALRVLPAVSGAAAAPSPGPATTRPAPAAAG